MLYSVGLRMVPAPWARGVGLYEPGLLPAPNARHTREVRPALSLTPGTYKAMTQRAISWPLLSIKLIERGGYIRSKGRGRHVAEGSCDWQEPCGRNGTRVCLVFAYMCLSVCVYG